MTYNTKLLQGGTIAKVILVFGVVVLKTQTVEPFELVLKIQAQYHRPFDPQSWRREYDFLTLDIHPLFNSNFKPPICYKAQFAENEIRLWLSYHKGTSGHQLSLQDLTEVAYQLGHFQGQIKNPKSLSAITPILTQREFLKNEWYQWTRRYQDYAILCGPNSYLPKSVIDMLNRNPWDDQYSMFYHYIRSTECNLPTHLKQMMIDFDTHFDELWHELSDYPLILTHRDFWIENIIKTPDGLTILDWDCVGLGVLGEDLASLIGDDTTIIQMTEGFKNWIASYNQGLSDAHVPFEITHKTIVQMILMKYGYRWIQSYLFSEDSTERYEIQSRFQLLYDELATNKP
ncbi:aminoglycoside phosphotransferase family protein [Methanobacterium sp. YSL]|nr:aminoglycoside phosphotransferase family protein [Methanobacterium sp. YSL]